MLEKEEDKKQPQRASNGDFLPGNTMAKGAHHSLTTWRTVLIEAQKQHYTAEKVVKVLETMYNRIIKYGDTAAAKIWLDRGLGKVKEQIDVDITTQGDKIQFTFIPAGKKNLDDK